MLLSKYIRKKFDEVLGRYEGNELDYYFSPKDFPDIKVKNFDVVSDYKGVMKTNVNNKEMEIKIDKKATLKGNFYYYGELRTDEIIIFDHGIGAGHLAYFKEIELLARHGYTVYSYDHTGCVSSEGDGITSFSQGVHDLDNVINAIKNTDQFKDTTFKLVGHSWGGYSAMNVVVFQPKVTHVVSLAGFLSARALCSQYIPSFVQRYVKEVMDDERMKNPKYADLDAQYSLKESTAKLMYLQSKDDDMVKYNYAMEPLKSALGERKDTYFLSFENRRHDPYLTDRAVALDVERTEKQKKLKKAGKLSTEAEKNEFKNSYDPNALNELDPVVWEKIFEFLQS